MAHYGMRNFVLVLILFSSYSLSALASTCVLVYERDNQPVTKAVTSFFAPVPDTQVKVEAIPLDFLNCVKNGAHEIVLIAHGFWRQETGIENPVFQLGYFVRATMPNGKEAYQAKLFYNKIFEEAYKALEKEKHETGTTRLKRVRFAACGIESLKITHPYFTRILDEFVEEYDEAPVANNFLTRLLAGDTPGVKRSISYPWLSKSGRCDEATQWHTRRGQRRACTSDSQSGCNRARATKFCRAIQVL